MKDRQPEYIQRFLRERKYLTIAITDHAVRSRHGQSPVTSAQIFQAVQRGQIDIQDCREFEDRPYDKIATYAYLAKERRTLKVILTVNWTTWTCEVESTWTYPGRQHRGRADPQRRKER